MESNFRCPAFDKAGIMVTSVSFLETEDTYQRQRCELDARVVVYNRDKLDFLRNAQPVAFTWHGRDYAGQMTLTMDMDMGWGEILNPEFTIQAKCWPIPPVLHPIVVWRNARRLKREQEEA